MRRLGFSRRVHTCARCGKRNLARTVAFQRPDRSLVHYGAECARTVHASKSRHPRTYGEMEYFKPHGVTVAPALLKRIHKRAIGTLDGMRVWIVDGEVVRNKIDIDFVIGGNPARYRFVSPGEIWVESMTPTDMAPTLLHERVEDRLMREGLSYDAAHERASRIERKLRSRIEAGSVKVGTTGDAVRVAARFDREASG